MWMFLKVMLAMSAAAGVAAMPTVLLSHHDQPHTTGQISVQSNSHSRTFANDTTSDMQTTGSTQGSFFDSTKGAQTVTVFAGGKGAWTFAFPGPIPQPPTPPSPPSAPKQPPVPPAKPTPPKPGSGATHAATVTWGTVQSVGNGKLTIVPTGKSAVTYTVNGDTHVVCLSGPIQADEENTGISRLKPGDHVMVISHDGEATLVVDHGGINGPYLPLGGGSLQGSVQGSVSTQSSGAVSATDR